MTDALEPALVPELLVADLDRSLAFWCGLCGFTISYARPEERFAYVVLGSAHLEAGVVREYRKAGDVCPLRRAGAASLRG